MGSKTSTRTFKESSKSLNSEKKVFISYSNEDYDLAKRLFNDLKKAHLDPWLDKESLLAGEKWREIIRAEIRKTDFFIPLLSTNSVGKKGFVQKEWKEAFDYIVTQPNMKKFIIPVRIDACSIPKRKLMELHWVDLFPKWEQGISLILKSILSYPGVEDRLMEFFAGTNKNEYIPVLGPACQHPFIPSEKEIARKWSKELGYPFEDEHQLDRVSQFLSIMKDDDSNPKRKLCEIIGSTKSPNFNSSQCVNNIYSNLADLHMPIYVTTNYDYLMEDCLRQKGKEPISEFCRWNNSLSKYARDSLIESVLVDDRKNKFKSFKPHSAQPLVYHLCGEISVPRSLVLTEKDLYDFLIELNKNAENILHPIIVKALTSPMLLLGFNILDSRSRIIFQSIAKFMNIESSSFNVLIVSETAVDDDPKIAKDYCEEYVKKMVKTKVIWSQLDEFSTKLRDFWSNSNVRSSD